MTVETPETILAYWFDEVGPKGWYDADPARDAVITERFMRSWMAAQAGRCGLWLSTPTGILGYIVICDQFSRNMFRNDSRAFELDPLARAASRIAVERRWDMDVTEQARQFFYMPLVHAENIVDQDRAVSLISERMPQTGESTLLHAKAHREIIAKFGRFPFRNGALGRETTPQEQDFLDNGGYGQIVRDLQAAGGKPKLPDL